MIFKIEFGEVWIEKPMKLKKDHFFQNQVFSEEISTFINQSIVVIEVWKFSGLSIRIGIFLWEWSKQDPICLL